MILFLSLACRPGLWLAYIGHRYCTTVGPSVSDLSPSYTENKYEKRVTVYSNAVKFSRPTVSSLGLREIDVL